MWKIVVFSLLLSFNHAFGQANPQEYRYIKIGDKEGLYVDSDLSIYGREKYFNILKKFENDFERINNGYIDFYRIYWGYKDKKEGIHLWVFLIPKLDKKRPYLLTMDKRTLSVKYYPNRKSRLSNVTHDMIWPYE
ncbi:hypothetical protein [Elizabethkingia anophelis]|uniref:hypothetical protein n=1 Tax=Elizabethkingia anophelis TaxID=1117645 RepID=UPI000442B3EF|nr:hypothetical protein [Elizabethkingia anophelis]MCT4012782.1 hypothetical protein [Elizabethkingia anophelis]MDV3896312.1 hypothetical protein [Elizabethkingia anophelis]OPC52842.1 hypothetical protein BAY06_01730 [Elizabethkingia anophelis]CDN74435.1 conserved exported hypothetical protein [Elizabethkingia anophelis]CDN78263.1 conserved exported hypothetical protein [Elizabethkingia anophelis]